MEKDSNIRKNVKLEELEKKNIHSVPEGYFDRLPQIIQSKAVESKAKPATLRGYGIALKYALPAVLIVVMSVYLLVRNDETQPLTPQELLAQVSTEEIVDYLADTDMTTDEILNSLDITEVSFDFDTESTNIINEELTPEELDELLNEYDNFSSGDTL